MPGLDPNSLSTASRLWLDGAFGVYKDAGVTAAVANTDTVQQWNDRSANANNWSQATAGNRPAYKLDTYKGVYMATTGDKFMSAGVAITTNLHLFFVCKIYSSVVNSTFWGHSTNINWLGDADGSRCFDSSATANLYAAVGGTTQANVPVFWINGRPSYMPASGGKQLNEWCIYEVKPASSTASTVNQFKDRTFAGREIDAAFGDVAVFDTALSAGDRTSLYAYFSAKYNIPIVGSALTSGGVLLNRGILTGGRQ